MWRPACRPPRTTTTASISLNVGERAGNFTSRTGASTLGRPSTGSPVLAKLLLLNGPNLNLLGSREPAVYGHATLAQIESELVERCAAAGHELVSLQSNAEHELVDRVQAARSDGTGFILINPAAFTHTSVALRDALAAVAIPFIEIHLSNPHAREPFRHHSYFSDLAVGVVCGFGVDSYRFALSAALARLDKA